MPGLVPPVGARIGFAFGRNRGKPGAFGAVDAQSKATLCNIFVTSGAWATSVDEPRQDNECKRDPYLSERLQAEAPGILAWLVRGCLAWQKEGLKPPDKVKLATEEYRESEDDIARFISECCVVGGAGQFVKAGELFQAYTRWAETNGLQKVGGRRFGEYIKRLFNVGPRTRTGYQYLGIGLLENPERE